MSAVTSSVTCKYIFAFMIMFVGEVHSLVSTVSKGMENSGAFLKTYHIAEVGMGR